jgi:hypothetical protein
MPCAGNTGEICGGGNQVQIYQDIAWQDPTSAELINVLQQYNASLAQVFLQVQQYQSDITALQNAGTSSSGSKVKRLPPSLQGL